MKKWIVYIGLLFSLCFIVPGFAEERGHDGLGQTIQIYTRFRSFVGKPSWLLIIRDLDNDQNVPHLFDISRGDNFWLVFTYGRNYLITVSNLKINTYKSKYNDFGKYTINDFCHLESHGRIVRGESMYITIDGDLTPDPSSITCHVSKFPDTNFSVVPNAPE
jgi:hypothetical protein